MILPEISLNLLIAQLESIIVTLDEIEKALGLSGRRSTSDYYKWSKNHFVNANSYSLNPKVLLVYHEIMDHEHSDSEYWNCGSGNEIVAVKLAEFDMDDWNALEVDLPNWNTHQQILFSAILTADYDFGSISESIVEQRSYLYAYIITIVDILSAIDLMGDEFLFLKEGAPKPKPILAKLNELFKQIEVSPLIIGNYLRRERFDYLKGILTEVNQIADRG